MAQDHDKFVGKKVVLVRNLSEPNEKGEKAVELEGTVEVANELGLVLKPKGKVQLELITNEEIEPDSIRFAPEKPKAIKPKTLKPIGYGQARSHLLERHGYTLSQINEMSEADAFELHESIDHREADLGHVHGDKSSTERSQAIADAEGDEEEDVA